MLVLHIYPYRETNREVDALGRDGFGCWPGMTDLQLFHQNQGLWVVGEDRVRRERYALFVAVPEDNKVRVAVEIDRFDLVYRQEALKTTDYRMIQGRILEPGHPVYEEFVGQSSPVVRGRNPVGYYDSKWDNDDCRCGCGQRLAGGGFVRGHEQTALHDRVRKVGTVAEFVDWFDGLTAPLKP